MMKLLYIAARWDPQDPDSGSGLDYNAYETLKNLGYEIKIAGPFASQQTLLERAIRKIVESISRKRLIKFFPSYIKLSNQAVQRKIASFQPQVIFSRSSISLVNIDLTVPLVYMCDSSVAWTRKAWPEFSTLGYALMQHWEKKVIDKASHIITFSDASFEILRNFYHKPANQITVHPIPSSLPEQLCSYQEKPFGPGEKLKLVHIGRVYGRKGADIAIEATRLLNTNGIPTHLRIVGQEGPSSENIEFMGLFSKKDPHEITEYVENYRWAHFQIFPSRFETAGIVASEAAGFGIPTITNAAGGLSTTVKHGVSGVVLPQGSPTSEYVQVIKEYWQNPEKYESLRQSTYERYQSELTWKALGKVLSHIIESVGRVQL